LIGGGQLSLPLPHKVPVHRGPVKCLSPQYQLLGGRPPKMQYLTEPRCTREGCSRGKGSRAERAHRD